MTDRETYATSPVDDIWSMLALPPQATARHYRVLLALRTFSPDPVTGVRSVRRDRLAAAARLDPDTVKQTVRELAGYGVIRYTPGVGRGSYSEFWIVPVPPEKGGADTGKGGSQTPPFKVPGKGGWAPSEKGGADPRKRGVRSTRSPAKTQTQGEVPQGEVLKDPPLAPLAESGQPIQAAIFSEDQLPAAPPKPDPLEGFDKWWAAYPRKVDKAPARKAYAKAIKEGADPSVLIAAAARYADEKAGQERRFIKHPATWLNKESWANEPEQAAAGWGQAATSYRDPSGPPPDDDWPQSVAPYRGP